MTAKEMFEKAGWGVVTATYLTTRVMYEKQNDSCGFDTITFFKNGKMSYSSRDDSGFERGYVMYDVDLLNAIQQQLKELEK